MARESIAKQDAAITNCARDKRQAEERRRQSIINSRKERLHDDGTVDYELQTGQSRTESETAFTTWVAAREAAEKKERDRQAELKRQEKEEEEEWRRTRLHTVFVFEQGDRVRGKWHPQDSWAHGTVDQVDPLEIKEYMCRERYNPAREWDLVEPLEVKTDYACTGFSKETVQKETSWTEYYEKRYMQEH